MSDASHATSARDAKPARAVHMLDAAEVAPFLEISNWRALGSIAFNWTLVAAAAALVAWRPNALSILLALFVIGARQLGFAVLMHDAAHRSLLRTARASVARTSLLGPGGDAGCGRRAGARVWRGPITMG